MLARRMPARVSSLTGNIVDVVGRRIFPGRVEWAGGRIVRIVPTPGKRSRQQIAPGFVDAHVHIESSLMPPSEFARWAVVHGTVATVSDPHEIANVLGEAGVRYMLDDARRSPLKFHFGAPSCVPATDRESSGATLDAKAVAKLLARRDVYGLSEVMNYPGLLGGDPEVLAKIRYELYTDPATGATLEYRAFGNAQMDTSVHTIEANYGFAKCNTDALKRIVIPS